MRCDWADGTHRVVGAVSYLVQLLATKVEGFGFDDDIAVWHAGVADLYVKPIVRKNHPNERDVVSRYAELSRLVLDQRKL